MPMKYSQADPVDPVDGSEIWGVTQNGNDRQIALSDVSTFITGGTATVELIRDTMGTALTDSGLVVVTVDDPGDTIDVGVPSATAAEIRTGTSTAKAITPGELYDSAVQQTLVDGANIAWDMASGYNAKVTLGGNRTLSAPTNFQEGITYALQIIQDGTGSRTLTLPAAFKFGAAGSPTLSTAAGKKDFIFLYCYDAATPEFRATFSKDS